MNKEDWKVFRCPNCMNNHICYMPALSDNERLRSMELKEYEEFGATLHEDGRFTLKCEVCGKEIEELPYEEWDASTICEVLGNILEDDNRHSLTRIGYMFWHCMSKAGVEDKHEETLRELLSYYSEHQSFQYW